MTTLKLQEIPSRFDGRWSLATHHQQARASRTRQLRQIRADTGWRTPGGVPFVWIGSNPPPSSDQGVERVREFNRAYAGLQASNLSVADRDAEFARIAGTSLAAIPGTAAYAICAPDDNRD